MGTVPLQAKPGAPGHRAPASQQPAANTGAERRFNPPVEVTIGLIDGDVRQGRLAVFSPKSLDVILEVAEADDSSRRIVLPAERVAYIGFSGTRDSKVAIHIPNAVPLRIHVAGGFQFAVELSKQSIDDPIGYYALPAEEDPSGFHEMFFYSHGVNLRERHEPIGELLVFEGMVNDEELSEGLGVQARNRSTKLGEVLVEQEAVEVEVIEAAAVLQKRKRMRIGEVLIEAGLATDEDIESALAVQKKRAGKRLGEVLVEMGIVSETNLARALANKFHMDFGDLDTMTVSDEVIGAVPLELIERYGFLPVAIDERSITVAISDPLATEQIDVLRLQVGKRIREVVVPPAQLKAHVAELVSRREREKNAAQVERILEELNSDEELSTGVTNAVEEVAESDSAVIRLVNQIILDAVRQNASDVHIEPNGQERATVVRFRVDGECFIYQEIPPPYRNPIVARLKIMARLDISERRKPQDGKIRFPLGDRKVELRVATIPTVNGNEDVVMRILASSKPMPLEQMGMNERNLRELMRLVRQPYGLLLCVGPTGSGKTTTLHAALGSINTPETKIWTAEDPVEITQPGLRQVQVSHKIGLTFAAALRAFLRADPDVIMVGEMRDEETAGIAVESSLTGHLVLSTLHTNNAPETITRLLDMNLDPFSFADALLGVLAQRLARRVCSQCREQYTPTKLEYEEFASAAGEAMMSDRAIRKREDLTLWRGKGCSACGNSGYRGRLAIHELLVATDPVKRAIARREPVDVIRDIAVEEGMTTLRSDGLDKCLAGQTDFRQIQSVSAR